VLYPIELRGQRGVILTLLFGLRSNVTTLCRSSRQPATPAP